MKGLTYPIGTLPGGFNVTLHVPQQTLDRLAMTCFRGTRLARAGNFSRWSSFQELWSSDLRLEIEADVLERAREYAATEPQKRRHDERFDVVCDEVVGWTSTAPIERFSKDDLEPFYPNGHAVAMRVRSDAGRLAPATTYVTVVYQLYLNAENKEWFAVVYSLYPGIDIGPMRNEKSKRRRADITEREGVVFFDFNHVGEPIENGRADGRNRRRGRPVSSATDRASSYPA